jgi:FkbM family methyltransferase
MPAEPRHVLDDLLSEPSAAAAARAAALFESLAGPAPTPLVLMGAGNLGRKTVVALRQLGRTVVAFADNNPDAQGRLVEGLPVHAPAEAVRLHGGAASFVVTIWGAGQSHRYDRMRAQLVGLGATRVAPAAALFWAHPDTFLPYFALDLPQHVLAAAPAVRAAFDALSDDDARAEFLAQLRWRLTLDSAQLRPPRPHDRQYFETDLFSLGSREVFIDGGAYIGDTVEQFLAVVGGRFARVIAAEPDEGNYAKLVACAAALPDGAGARVSPRKVALGARHDFVRFDATGTAASVVGQGSQTVEAIALDDLTFELPPTLVKLDVEGAELDALEGARRLIARDRPVLAVCAYHRQDHLWRVPAALHALVPDYRLHLRSYGSECFDLVCYAVPPERSANG